jgi:hypothetical protein
VRVRVGAGGSPELEFRGRGAYREVGTGGGPTMGLIEEGRAAMWYVVGHGWR